jgi:excisionase family DNA binding protein
MGRSLFHEGVTDVSAPRRAEGPRARRLLSLDEAARYLGLGSRWAVRRLVVNGALPVVKIAGKWRLDVEDLDKLISAKKSVAPECGSRDSSTRELRPCSSGASPRASRLVTKR